MSQDATPIDADALEKQAERLRRLTSSLVRDFDRAEDVAQETCLKALTGGVKPSRSLAACLAGVARNVAWKLGRSEARREGRERQAARPEAQPSTLEMLTRLDEQQNVLACVRALAEPYRTTLLMRFFEELPPREIARRLGIPVETVKTRQKRGLHLMRQAMDTRHGGNRKAWLSTLAPVAGFDLLPQASSIAAEALKAGGNLVGQTTGWKLAAGLVVAVLVAGGGAYAFDLFASDPVDETVRPTLRTVDTDGPGLQGTAPKAIDASAEDPTAGAAQRDADPASAANAAAVPTEPHGADGPGDGKDPEAKPLDLSKVKPAVRHSPFGLPKRKPGRRFGGGGMGGPTGHWTKYGRLPTPRGTARIEVTVVDEDGQPFAGADVLLGPPDTAGVNGISFGDLRKLGKTDALGKLTASKLPDGGAAVFGNINNRLNGRSGLDGRHGTTTLLEPGKTAHVTLTLPLPQAKVGRIEGRILAADGTPARSALVRIGYQQTWTKADGAFAFDGVPEGEQSLSVRSTGHKSLTLTVTIPPEGKVVREVKLVLAEEGGVRLEGTVRGPDGKAVANANVYFIIVNDRNTARSLRTDDEGRYTIAGLPDRVREEPVRLQAGRFPLYASHVVTLENGLKTSSFDFTLPVRYVQVELTVVDADTGEPVEQLKTTAHRPESKRPTITLSTGRGTNARVGMAEAGLHTVTIDAMDHETMELSLDIQPDAEFKFKHTVKLKRTSPRTEWIHLTVLVTDLATGEPITTATIEVQDANTHEALARFAGRREGGEFLMPGPSGERRVVVSAEGYEPYAEAHTLEVDPGAMTIEVKLRAR